MRVIFQPQPSQPCRPAGFALIVIMCFLAFSLIVFASMMYWVSSNAKITLRNNAFNQAEGAAESATETVLAPMIRDYAYGALNPASSYTGTVPDQTGWPIGYNFYNQSLVIDTTSVSNLVELGSQFAGLSGFIEYCTNTITAIATNGPVAVPATVQQTIQFASVPVFQYAIFYNMDLEINPGAPMTINGAVHSNDNIWTTGDGSGANVLTFSTNVNASGSVYLRRSTNDPSASRTGNVVFTDTQNNPLNNADSLSMPIGTNNNPAAVVGLIQLPPSNLAVPTAAAYSATGSVYFYNAADLIITNDTTGTNFTVLYDNQNVGLGLTPVVPDMPIVTSHKAGVTTTYTTNFVYSFVTNATFYDYREKDTVQAIQLNVSNLVAWLTNNISILGTNRGGYQYNQYNTTTSTSKGHGINSVYIYNSVPMTASTLPGVRVMNGAQLPPAGLTVATAQPLYVMGNYNVRTNASGTQDLTLGSTVNGHTRPASFVADAVTVLSSSWKDIGTYTSTTSLGSRDAASTTINAACMEGIVPSTSAAYSGGVENFLRLLESWSGDTLTYNGSIVVMFPSQYATNLYGGSYYGIPTRNWGFDVNFSKGQGYLPPLTPQAKYVIRSSYSAW